MTYFQGKGRGYNSPQSRIMVGAFSLLIRKSVFLLSSAAKHSFLAAYFIGQCLT
jgi:hypothetical protein